MGRRPVEQLDQRVAFDRATHTYTAGGRRLLSVTEVLREAGLVDVQWFTQESRDRGSYVHRAIELDESDDLDDARLDLGTQGYITAWRRFKMDSGARVISNEYICYDEMRGYAGMTDFLLEINDRLGVADLKTGGALPSHAIQIAAYARCVEGVQDRWILHVKPDGRYKLVRHDEPSDEMVFLSALNVVQWKLRKGMVKP